MAKGNKKTEAERNAAMGLNSKVGRRFFGFGLYAPL